MTSTSGAYPNEENEMIEDENRADAGGSLAHVSEGKQHIARPNVSDEILPTLPSAPTLVPVLGFKGNETANASTGPVNAGRETVRAALEALPNGSRVVFATNDLGALVLAGAPIARATAVYRECETIAQACNCSVTLQEGAGTIAFCRSAG
jgi:hypothetical protein